MKLKELLSKAKSWWSDYSGKQSRHPILAILLSIFVAFLLWFYVQDAESPDYKKPFSGVSVKVEGLAEDLSVISGGETEVTITLRGKRTDLNRIKPDDLEAYISLAGITEPVKGYEASISALLPEGTELVDIFPKTTSLHVDRTVSMSFPLEVDLGTYTAAADTVITASPAVEEITVKGPQSVLAQVDRAAIATGDLGEVTQSFEKTLEFGLLDKDGKSVSDRHLVLPQKNVRVRFAVNLKKTVPLVVKTVHKYWAEDSWRYTVSPEYVTVMGEPELMAGVSEVAALNLDETQFDDTRLAQKVLPSELALPRGISLAETLGDISVTVNVTDSSFKRIRMPLASSHVVVTPPETADGKELPYSFDVDAITLKVRGSARTVTEATADDFYLHVDLSSFTTPGTREVTVEVVQTSATEGKFYAVGTYTLNVTIPEA
ncbi:MAG: hypothetical protein J6Z79_05200 [Clostridia bacterium]|nr:hypothetical protein [Clostridia bacterium]